MAHISITGVPTELSDAAKNWIAGFVHLAGHTGNVKDESGQVVYGHSDPEVTPAATETVQPAE